MDHKRRLWPRNEPPGGCSRRTERGNGFPTVSEQIRPERRERFGRPLQPSVEFPNLTQQRRITLFGRSKASCARKTDGAHGDVFFGRWTRDVFPGEVEAKSVSLSGAGSRRNIIPRPARRETHGCSRNTVGLPEWSVTVRFGVSEREGEHGAR